MKKRKRMMNLLYVPVVLLISAFVVYPLLRGIWFSFFKWNGYSQSKQFLGIRNYLDMWKDKYFLTAFGNTLLYGFGCAFLQNIAGLALALYVNSKFKGRNAVRTIVYLPVMISGLLMGYIMQFFFSLDRGIINEILGMFGIGKVYWLGNGTAARMIIVFVNSWQYVGGAMIIYLAGLQNIPRMYVEAAMLDGGSSWAVFRYVTIPLLAPAIATAVVQNVVGSLKLNDIIISLTGGGPAMATHSLSTYISYTYYSMEKAGYASAVGVFLFAFIFVVSFFMNRYFRNREVSY